MPPSPWPPVCGPAHEVQRAHHAYKSVHQVHPRDPAAHGGGGGMFCWGGSAIFLPAPPRCCPGNLRPLRTTRPSSPAWCCQHPPLQHGPPPLAMALHCCPRGGWHLLSSVGTCPLPGVLLALLCLFLMGVHVVSPLGHLPWKGWGQRVPECLGRAGGSLSVPSASWVDSPSGLRAVSSLQAC